MKRRHQMAAACPKALLRSDNCSGFSLSRKAYSIASGSKSRRLPSISWGRAGPVYQSERRYPWHRASSRRGDTDGRRHPSRTRRDGGDLAAPRGSGDLWLVCGALWVTTEANDYRNGCWFEVKIALLPVVLMNAALHLGAAGAACAARGTARLDQGWINCPVSVCRSFLRRSQCKGCRPGRAPTTGTYRAPSAGSSRSRPPPKAHHRSDRTR